MNFDDIKLKVHFYKTGSGTEPVRKWLQSLLLSLSTAHKKIIGEDIKTVQFGWPLGMPLVEKIKPFLWEIWEVRSKIPNGIARVLFTIDGNVMIPTAWFH